MGNLGLLSICSRIHITAEQMVERSQAVFTVDRLGNTWMEILFKKIHSVYIFVMKTFIIVEQIYYQLTKNAYVKLQNQ